MPEMRPERRVARREPAVLPAALLFRNGRSTDCTVLNLSATGAKLSLRKDFLLPSDFRLSIPGRRLLRHARLVWRRDGEAGVAFD
jgi:hypothetical protein